MQQPLNYSCIGIVAKHCDLTKLCVAENQAFEFDLSGLYCDFWYEILEYWNEVDNYDALVLACDGNAECISEIPMVENYSTKKEFIYGGTYLNCSGKSRNFKGINSIWTYYSYARYVMVNGINDTPSGMVSKTNEFSIPKTQKELDHIADMYRSMGFSIFNDSKNFLCGNRTIFTDFNDCKVCGCEKCNGGTKAKGYGIRGQNITKKL